MVRTLASVRRDDWIWGVVAALFVYTLTFTTFFTHPKGVYGLWTGLDYWLGQHEVGRGGEPEYFYVVVLFAEEWPMLLLGAIGAVAAFRRPTLLRLFLVWAFVVSLAVYSWAGEKFSWLVLHPLLPLILLAGIGVQSVWESRRQWYGAVGIAVTAIALFYSAYASFSANALHPRRPARVPRLHPVLGRGRARPRRGRGAGEEAARADRHDRRGGGRDVPLRLVLPPPERRLHRHEPAGRAPRRRPTC